ncbi:MFS transporter [Flavobacterium sp.]|uniref:MFS transporter n=1 Tax=Flavobacterium sp. TaxID=239 RepID=UPI003D0D7A1E
MIAHFVNDCKKLPVEIWFFVLMTLINRMGAMVVPFMSKYLYEDLHFTYAQIGSVMFCFGVGSIGGTFLVSRLARTYSAYKLMVLSMLLNGLMLFLLRYTKDFYMLCGMVFILNVFADMFRPSMIATLKEYVKKEELIICFSLIRSATNFGFIIAPLIAGFLILYQGYDMLFVIDSISSFIAIGFFVYFVKEKKLLYQINLVNIKSDPFVFFKDKLLLLHCLITVLTGVVFFQIFTVLPLYYTDVLKLEVIFNTYALVFYGCVLFLFEVALVSFIRRKGVRTLNAILYGLLSMALGYTLLMAFSSVYTVFFALIFLSFGVMLTFPFATDFVLERAFKKQEVEFMSYFQMSYGLAQLISAKYSQFLISGYGYATDFVVNVVIAILGAVLTYFLIISVIKERKLKKQMISEAVFS